MKKGFKLLMKIMSWFLTVFVILTLVITITKVAKPSSVGIDIDSLGMRKEMFLRRYGGNLNRTTFMSVKDLKNEVIDYYKMLLKGELGWTYKIVRTVDSMGNPISRRENIDPIVGILKTGFDRSIKLLSAAISIALILGILKGVFDSKKDKKSGSTSKLFTTVLGLSIPAVFLAPLLQMVGMWLSYTYKINLPFRGDETFRHMILPTIVLSILPTMYIARITAVAMDRAYENEYIRTAISKGSSKLRVMWIHVFRNAIVEIVGSLPSVLTILISDLAIVEYLFDYKGLTHMMLEYYHQGQSDVVTGIALVLCAIFAVFYLLLKILKFVLEPKGRSATI